MEGGDDAQFGSPAERVMSARRLRMIDFNSEDGRNG